MIKIAQWMNLQRIIRFVNPMRLYIACEKFRGLHLVEPGLTAGRLADEILKACCRLKYLIFRFV